MGNAVLESPPRQASPATPQEGNGVLDVIMDKLTAFDRAVEASEVLEIDGISVNNEPHCEVDDDSLIKVINHKLENAVEIEVDTVIQTPLADLIAALETFEFTKVWGVTRIVGYYSRVTNWNKSKVSELHDRHKGNYGL